MKNFLVFTIFLSLATACSITRQLPVEKKLVEVAEGWAQNSINAVAFRRNSIVSYRDTQFIAFYDADSYMVLGKRHLDSTDWVLQRTNYQGNIKDAHNSISIMVDGDGYLHAAWDHHNNMLRYTKSVAPWSLELTEKMPMTGLQEERVTYPEFLRMPSGDLVFLYRNGSSGNGNLILNTYSLATKEWSQLHEAIIDGEGKRNAYWQAAVDIKGTIHLSWVWRETSDVASNHDIAYAKSDDGGKTWKKSTGETYYLPIKESSAEYVARISQSRELINQTTMYVDEEGRAYIANYWRPIASDVPQYHLVYNDGAEWKTVQVSDRTTPFSLSGGGTKKIPIARPKVVAKTENGKQQVWMVFRDEERGNKVSLATCENLKLGFWKYQDLTGFSVGQWEPTIDHQLWATKKELHIFVQNVAQGDGEQTEELAPQPIYVLEVK